MRNLAPPRATPPAPPRAECRDRRVHLPHWHPGRHIFHRRTPWRAAPTSRSRKAPGIAVDLISLPARGARQGPGQERIEPFSQLGLATSSSKKHQAGRISKLTDDAGLAALLTGRHATIVPSFNRSGPPGLQTNAVAAPVRSLSLPSRRVGQANPMGRRRTGCRVGPEDRARQSRQMVMAPALLRSCAPTRSLLQSAFATPSFVDADLEPGGQRRIVSLMRVDRCMSVDRAATRGSGQHACRTSMRLTTSLVALP